MFSTSNVEICFFKNIAERNQTRTNFTKSLEYLKAVTGACWMKASTAKSRRRRLEEQQPPVSWRWRSRPTQGSWPRRRRRRLPPGATRRFQSAQCAPTATPARAVALAPTVPGPGRRAKPRGQRQALTHTRAGCRWGDRIEPPIRSL